MFKTVHGLKEPITFDDIQKCSCVGVCLAVVSETDDIITVFRSSSPPIVCEGKNALFYVYNITTKTKFIVRNTRSLLAYRRQWS